MSEVTISPEAKFIKATDSRGRDVSGLWIRNGRFYYQLYVPIKQRCQKVPLYDDEHKPIRTLQKAQEAVVVLRKARTEGESPEPRRAPFFPDFYKRYITLLEEMDEKSDLTILKEKYHLKGWAEHLGLTRVSQIRVFDVSAYTEKRKKEGLNSRTVNLDVIALSNCLQRAKKEGWIKGKLPTECYKPLKCVTPKRTLRTRAEIDALCAEAIRVKENGLPVYLTGDQLSDWLRFMQWCGARHKAALSCRWDQVNWDKKQLTLFTKYDKTVVVDFNEPLEAHLKSMFARRVEDAVYLFPSNRPGADGHLTRLYKTLLKVKTEVAKKFPDVESFTPHDLRHFFASWCCERGIDLLVLKEWLGHSDTKLIATTYGHLSNEHRNSSVKKLATQQAPESGGVDITKMAEVLKALQAAGAITITEKAA